MTKRLSYLYHLAEVSNLPSISKYGLMSTEALLSLANMPMHERAGFLGVCRSTNALIAPDVMVRDQRPMPPSALSKALEDGLTPSDWYRLLNGFVFFWVDPDRLERQRNACGDRPQIVLNFDGDALLDAFGDEAFVSPINSGNARRKPAPRGLKTLMPYREWLEAGWPQGQRWRSPVEVLFKATIPLRAPFLRANL